ncbi:MAG: IPExxxVDY family protein [Flavobacteriales bacterium]|nr:IPExxxVDY family protein [Flavobacteriales bacterium]MCB9449605.1 IPExxxVDY family protein [Flavobacteriales bacterium]
MAKKKILTLDDDFDFLLAGISSPLKDYRLCWAVNRELNLTLERTEDLEIFPSARSEGNSFSFYTFDDPEDHVTYHIVCNRNAKGMLVPEAKQADYFLMVKGHMPEKRFREIIGKLKQIANVQMAFQLDPNELKSAQNLLI